MTAKIKLIWDFRGQTATPIAQHHVVHLNEYIKINELPLQITGFETHSSLYATAFMVVYQSEMLAVRDALKPHRAVVFEE